MYKRRELEALLPRLERSQALRGQAYPERSLQAALRLMGLAGALACSASRVSARLATRLKAKASSFLLALPNILAEDVGESNKVVYEWVPPGDGWKPSGLEHQTILSAMSLTHLGAEPRKGLWLLSGRLEAVREALARWLRARNISAGYLALKPASLVGPEELVGTGQLPKFAADLVSSSLKGLYLSPTAEVQLGNLRPSAPINLCALTPCFRSEVAYGKRSAGLIRTFEFEKFELFSYCEPWRSARRHRAMLLQVVGTVMALGLPLRVLRLSGRETGFAASKTYDVEVWLPGSRMFMEIASVSNCADFQSRRSGLKMSLKGGVRHHPHTLNGSCLPLGRSLVALAENHYDPASGHLARWLRDELVRGSLV